jgi:hypothetical protein
LRPLFSRTILLAHLPCVFTSFPEAVAPVAPRPRRQRKAQSLITLSTAAKRP